MIRGETRLSASEMGMLLSAFSTAYGLSQIPIACCLTPSEDEARERFAATGGEYLDVRGPAR
jgi:sugar phosphate permease